MTQDRLTVWNGLFPYDVLARVGVTPMSNMKQVMDASFDLMARGSMLPQTRRAWEELRSLENRLFVDLFLYPVDLETALTDFAVTFDQ